MGALADFYMVLGASRRATSEEIDDAYRTAARRTHPDLGGSHIAFLEVDLARRVLSDPNARWRYDAVLALQDLLSTPTPSRSAELSSSATRAMEAMGSWRCPREIEREVAQVFETAAAQLDRVNVRQYRGSTSDRTGPARTSASSSEAAGEARRQAERLRKQTLETACEKMRAWPTYRRSVEHAPDESLQMRGLSNGYSVYRSLRRAQDELRRTGGVRSDGDARLYVHVSRALVDVTHYLLSAQPLFGRNYQLRDPEWLRSQLDRAWTVLHARGITAGKPPWPEAGVANASTTSGFAGSPEGDGVSHEPQNDPPPSESAQRVSRLARQASRRRRTLTYAASLASGLLLVVILVASAQARAAVSYALAAVSVVGGAIALGYLGWLVLRSEGGRQLVGRTIVVAVVGTAKAAVIMLRLLGIVIGGLFGLLSRRR